MGVVDGGIELFGGLYGRLGQEILVNFVAEIYNSGNLQ